MLCDHRSSKKKLRPSWRGPFIVTGHGGTHSRSYTLRQIDGTPIPRTYHIDQPKLFKFREGRLVTGNLAYQPARTSDLGRLASDYHQAISLPTLLLSNRHKRHSVGLLPNSPRLLQVLLQV